jgi:7-keto-8-aminopelargonate synthetase-like enzyme
MASRDAIFLDELSHNSIVSGCKASPAEVIFFRHNDLGHLDELLAKRRAEFKNVLIVSESLFSMDGDTVDLPRLVALKKKHATWLLLDEAHSIGALGATGRGLCEYSGVDPNEIDLIVGTLSKSFASCGGFVCAKSSIIQWMRHTLPGFVYSVGLSPVISASALQALRLCQSESWRIERLRRNSESFVELAREAGLDTGPAIGRGVVPILFRDSLATLHASQHLLAQGFYVPPIIQVGVPKDQPRLRFFLSASHTETEIRDVIAILAGLQSADTVEAGLAATAMAAPGLAESGLAESGLADPALVVSVHEQMGAAS